MMFDYSKMESGLKLNPVRKIVNAISVSFQKMDKRQHVIVFHPI